MTEADDVMVQPLTSYMEGAEHKSAQSKPYKMPRWQAAELEALGHVRILGDNVESGAQDGRAADAEEAMIDNDGKPRGRRGADRHAAALDHRLLRDRRPGASVGAVGLRSVATA